ncbi:chymotrypsin-1-like [Prorops nasuta]|uniref:chymotrypsin-1-like n=1 Tax=Prorops nasuta TaxID=863751 RepID=UPI0034D013CA
MQVLTTLLFAGLALCAYGLPSKRSVGGEDAPDGKYLYMVSLRYNGKHICTGTILNKRYILTSALCTVNTPYPGLTAHVGVRRIEEAGAQYRVVSFIRHPKFEAFNYVNDVAVLRVEHDIVFNDKVQPVQLVSEKPKNEVYNVVLAGWGRTLDDGRNYNHMKVMDYVTTTEKECKTIYPEENSTHICTSKQRRHGPCFGDFGGPLVNEEGKQVGILSNGFYVCYADYPLAFSSIPYYYQFIKENSKV